MSRMVFINSAFALIVAASVAMAEDDIFSRLDTDGDGFVRAAEIEKNDQRLFARLLRKADGNGDDRLDAEEFAAGTSATEPAASLPSSPNQGSGGRQFNPQEFFRRLDRNRDGKLSRQEAPERLAANFDRVDANGDGGIQPPELAKVIAAMRNQGQIQRSPNQQATPQQRAQFASRIFQQSDRNRDGKLSLDEIPEQRKANFRRLLQRVDNDNDQAVTREQFIQATSKTRPK